MGAPLKQIVTTYCGLIIIKHTKPREVETFSGNGGSGFNQKHEQDSCGGWMLGIRSAVEEGVEIWQLKERGGTKINTNEIYCECSASKGLATKKRHAATMKESFHFLHLILFRILTQNHPNLNGD